MRQPQDNSSLSWLKSGWDAYMDMLPRLLPFLLALEVFKIPSLWLIHHFHTYTWSLIYSLLILTPVSLGLNLVYIKLHRRQSAGVRDFLRGFFIYPRSLAVSLSLGLLTLGGLIAFIVPGIILYLTYCLSEYALADKNTGIKESFALSARLTAASRGQLASVILLIVSIEILAPEIAGISGGFKNSDLKFDFKSWTMIGHALKDLVFLPWLNMSMAAAYNRLLRTLPRDDNS
ncbi:MAG: hypothetical protein A2021_02745 [Elusimicrobia bacterium GWF2_52_66]|nr:MAG: hypothetical protein A2X33_02645 [Elusimicrobia bacterium GWA2_51_34]OGR86488.1 MAG: hypothetical protein A2021_02745 [Elusimicrobia bacterium GWF2_52_66]HAF94724.1 hypothetical protein [Elusimicrobiota bacterium]HCE97729.1 hypothetical protein [Elusimicrobiota bacterium]